MIDAAEGNIGSADLSNLIIDNCLGGIATNDARRLEVRGALITNCLFAFQGFDHLLFRVDDSIVWDCDVMRSEPPGRDVGNPARSGRDVEDRAGAFGRRPGRRFGIRCRDLAGRQCASGAESPPAGDGPPRPGRDSARRRRGSSCRTVFQAVPGGLRPGRDRRNLLAIALRTRPDSGGRKRPGRRPGFLSPGRDGDRASGHGASAPNRQRGIFRR